MHFFAEKLKDDLSNEIQLFVIKTPLSLIRETGKYSPFVSFLEFFLQSTVPISPGFFLAVFRQNPNFHFQKIEILLNFSDDDIIVS